jgi:hypothetical protein
MSRLLVSHRIVVALFLGVLALLIFHKAMLDGLNHDEQQFVAPPVLVAKEGAVPYRDFALLHMPHLVYVYALLDRFTSWHLMAARVFSAACAFGMIALVFGLSLRLLDQHRPSMRIGLAAGVVVLVVCSSLFIRTAGRTWNHDSSLLPVLAAFVTFIAAARSERPGAWLFATGALVGLGIGVRLTFAPIVAPFGVAVLAMPSLNWRRRVALAAAFSVGVLLVLLPAVYFFAAEHDRFLYGNVLSQRLRLLDPTDERAQKTMTLWRKFRYLGKEVMRTDAPLFLAFFGMGVPAIVGHFRKQTANPWPGALLLTILLPFLLFGAMSPTRFQSQHYYALVPFVAVGACFGLSRITKRAAIATSVLVIAAVGLHGGDMARYLRPSKTSDWMPMRIHEAGRAIGRAVGQGKVLTLAPIAPLEGGARVYPELAVGPFAFRLAHLLPPEKRRQFRVVAPEDLAALADADPPAGILLGAEDEDLEAPLAEIAESRGYLNKLKLGKLTLHTR